MPTQKQYLDHVFKFVQRLSDIRFAAQVLFVLVVLLMSWSGIKTIQTNYGLQRQITAISQHNQLQSQMQNEYRSYAALSSSLKAKYDTLDELQAKVDTAKAAKEAKESKSNASKGKQTKPKESGAQEAKEAESQARQETRATNPQSSAKPAADSTAGPTLHPIP